MLESKTEEHGGIPRQRLRLRSCLPGVDPDLRYRGARSRAADAGNELLLPVNEVERFMRSTVRKDSSSHRAKPLYS